MKVINFFAGPGAGKSTISAHLFALLKWQGLNCEIAREWIKEKVWQDINHPSLNNQLYIFAKQDLALSSLDGKVDFAITDSPLILSLIYGNANPQSFEQLVLARFRSYKNINFFVERKKAYNPNGRLQTSSEAEEIDSKILEMLRYYDIPFTKIPGEFETAGIICNQLKDMSSNS